MLNKPPFCHSLLAEMGAIRRPLGPSKQEKALHAVRLIDGLRMGQLARTLRGGRRRRRGRPAAGRALGMEPRCGSTRESQRSDRELLRQPG